ncbi:MAG: hypothetical protein ABI596_12075 [Pyrinomonadaceae bacterium]
MEGLPTLSIPPVIIAALAASFLIICGLWQRPITTNGKYSLILSAVNALSWFIVLPLETSGHPPPFLIVGYGLWLINVPLLIANATILWITRKSNEERRAYLIVASTYVVLNLLILCVLPLFLLLWSASD